MVRGLTVLVWVAVFGSATFWAWKLAVPESPKAARPPATPMVVGPLEGLHRLLGESHPSMPVQTPPAASERERFQLMGVIADAASGSNGEGLALIAVDGQRARAYRVGAMLDASWALQSVQSRGIRLAPRHGDARIEIELPPWPLAAAGGQRQTAGADRELASKALAPAAAGLPFVLRSGTAPAGVGQDSAPNTLLNNPGDMAPADASPTALPKQ